jgi:IS1 family transposase
VAFRKECYSGHVIAQSRMPDIGSKPLEEFVFSPALIILGRQPSQFLKDSRGKARINQICGQPRHQHRALCSSWSVFPTAQSKYLGKRDQQTTDVFVEGIRHATARGRFQVTTDGFAPYKSAISNALHDRCDFAQLIKVYKASSEGEGRYSPAEVSSVEVVPIMGRPDPDRICTSIIERSNLSLRMGLRRFTRLTNGFSKKWENHCAAVMLWYCWYNFGRVHKSLRTTPAMAAGIADHVWSVRELLA